MELFVAIKKTERFFFAEVVEALPAELAVTYSVVPVMKHDDLLTVATSDPSAMDVIDALRYRLNCDIEAVVATQDQIDQR